ncbi:MAG: hypothetical protein HY238_21370 [Acidobacteria bacterium]|nr:hypothetical protein [Acidobacteriota bacterium]
MGEGNERARQDLWKRTLAQVPTTFGRIAYLASLRDPDTGRYEHFGLAQVYSEEDANRALGQSHQQAFSEWLKFPLERQKQDLEEYLGALGKDRRRVLDTWGRLAPYRNLLPSSATEAEQELFIADLELILDLLRGEIGSSSQSRGA